MKREPFYEYLAKFPPHFRGKVLAGIKEIDGLSVEIPEVDEILKRISSAPVAQDKLSSSQR